MKQELEKIRQQLYNLSQEELYKLFYNVNNNIRISRRSWWEVCHVEQLYNLSNRDMYQGMFEYKQNGIDCNTKYVLLIYGYSLSIYNINMLRDELTTYSNLKTVRWQIFEDVRLFLQKRYDDIEVKDFFSDEDFNSDDDELLQSKVLKQQISTQNKLLLTVLDRYNISLPDTHKTIEKLDLIQNDAQYLNVTDNRNRISKMRIGRTLKSIFPELKDYVIQNIVKDISTENKPQQYQIRQFSDVSNWYKYVPSCMQNSPQTVFYDHIDNVTILVLFKNDKPIGRALKWNNVKGVYKGIYIDTFYSKYTQARQIFTQYIQQNKYVWENGNGGKKMVVDCGVSLQRLPIPYIDTFRYTNCDFCELSNLRDSEHIIKLEYLIGEVYPVSVEQFVLDMGSSTLNQNVYSLDDIVHSEIVDEFTEELQEFTCKYHKELGYQICCVENIDKYTNHISGKTFFQFLLNSDIDEIDDTIILIDYREKQIQSFYIDEVWDAEYHIIDFSEVRRLARKVNWTYQHR